MLHAEALNGSQTFVLKNAVCHFSERYVSTNIANLTPFHNPRWTWRLTAHRFDVGQETPVPPAPENRAFFIMGTKGVLLGELPSRGRSIQAGSLCYTNGCAVDVLTRLDASSASPVGCRFTLLLINRQSRPAVPACSSLFSRLVLDRRSKPSPLQGIEGGIFPGLKPRVNTPGGTPLPRRGRETSVKLC